MSLERYLRDELGIRKYVELMECIATAKRQNLMNAARKENPFFVETAEKYLFTFEKITRLPDLELTEVLGAPGLKAATIAFAIASVQDPSAKDRLLALLPRNLAPEVAQGMKDNPTPTPYEAGAARLQLIKKARELEQQGKLDSAQIPKFVPGHFSKKSAI